MCSEKFDVHRADDRQVVDAATYVREKIADRDSALPVLAEFPRRIEHHANVVELRRRDVDLDGLAMLAVEARFRVERIDLRRPAIHEQENHARRLGPEMRKRSARGPFAGALAFAAVAHKAGRPPRTLAPRHQIHLRSGRAFRGGKAVGRGSGSNA